MEKLSRICVYCGSSHGRKQDYADAAVALAEALTKRGISLVYGGGRVGIMGVIADAVVERGGDVFGVIPRDLDEKEIAHQELTELHIVKSMHERKAMMAELSDGFIALPGGLGTMEELFEMWTWAQLGYHPKPLGLLNVAGYYDPLITFLDQTVQEQFVRDNHRAMLLVDDEPNALVDRLNAYEPPSVVKWIDKDSV